MLDAPKMEIQDDTIVKIRVREEPYSTINLTVLLKLNERRVQHIYNTIGYVGGKEVGARAASYDHYHISRHLERQIHFFHWFIVVFHQKKFEHVYLSIVGQV